ncbi:hypothetical protein LX64_01695 [Chitinophaga skermanii]|uniref:Uncharacterized protein n=1 Tax=Chitinophaga skermanii TaxID=331697 RepID=A0A327QRA7_9BACT|nr:hypothetical protein [Chitinophaga skermanii]RAJ06568.1 hypothetical protein LX64_01695 [Chitinophaga skermanii]
MGWKFHVVVIEKKDNITIAAVAEVLGWTLVESAPPTPFLDTLFSKDKYIGEWNNYIYIVHNELPVAFFQAHPSSIETTFQQQFPHTEIAALALNSTIDLYGFHLSKMGRRLRVKHGADLQVFINEGALLLEEMEVMNTHILSPEELEEMQEDWSREELAHIIDQERSIKTVMQLTKRYFEKPIDTLGSLVEKISMQAHQ